MSENVSSLLYIVAGVLFIMALRGLSHPTTSRQGNLYGMVGMGLAILTTLVGHPPAGAGGPRPTGHRGWLEYGSRWCAAKCADSSQMSSPPRPISG